MQPFVDCTTIISHSSTFVKRLFVDSMTFFLTTIPLGAKITSRGNTVGDGPRAAPTIPDQI
jgi:hypothetical protein